MFAAPTTHRVVILILNLLPSRAPTSGRTRATVRAGNVPMEAANIVAIPAETRIRPLTPADMMKNNAEINQIRLIVERKDMRSNILLPSPPKP